MSSPDRPRFEDDTGQVDTGGARDLSVWFVTTPWGRERGFSIRVYLEGRGVRIMRAFRRYFMSLKNLRLRFNNERA